MKGLAAQLEAMRRDLAGAICFDEKLNEKLRVTMAKCQMRVSATCCAAYQKLRQARLTISSASFEGLRRRLQTDGDRIQREIEEYKALSEQARCN